MYIFLKSTSSNSTLVTNYLSKYTWKLEFAGVLYQLRFVQPLLLMWLCRFIFGDCLPLSLALHHLPTTINLATTTPIFAQQCISTKRDHLITHPKHHSSLRWRPWLSAVAAEQRRQSVGGRASAAEQRRQSSGGRAAAAERRRQSDSRIFCYFSRTL